MHSVVVYHSISSPAIPMDGDIDISAPRFNRQLEWLARWRTVAPLTTTLTETRRRLAAITFDDGYRDNLTVALPLLEKFDLPMTLFVVAGFVGRDGYLNANELREISRSRLITIGAHGQWHRHFNRLTIEEARTELLQARRILEDMIHQRVDLMAWPFGECNERLERLSAECGYRAAWSVWKGSNGMYSRWRAPLGRNDNLPRFIAKATGIYALTEARWHRFKDAENKTTMFGETGRSTSPAC